MHTRIILDSTGDLEKEKDLIELAKLRQTILHTDMNFNGLQQSKTEHRLTDGSVITVSSCFGLDTINIFSPVETTSKGGRDFIVLRFRSELLTPYYAGSGIASEPRWIVWDIAKDAIARVPLNARGPNGEVQYTEEIIDDLEDISMWWYTLVTSSNGSSDAWRDQDNRRAWHNSYPDEIKDVRPGWYMHPGTHPEFYVKVVAVEGTTIIGDDEIDSRWDDLHVMQYTPSVPLYVLYRRGLSGFPLAVTVDNTTTSGSCYHGELYQSNTESNCECMTKVSGLKTRTYHAKLQQLQWNVVTGFLYPNDIVPGFNIPDIGNYSEWWAEGTSCFCGESYDLYYNRGYILTGIAPIPFAGPIYQKYARLNVSGPNRYHKIIYDCPGSFESLYYMEETIEAFYDSVFVKNWSYQDCVTGSCEEYMYERFAHSYCQSLDSIQNVYYSYPTQVTTPIGDLPQRPWVNTINRLRVQDMNVRGDYHSEVIETRSSPSIKPADSCPPINGNSLVSEHVFYQGYCEEYYQDGIRQYAMPLIQCAYLADGTVDANPEHYPRNYAFEAAVGPCIDMHAWFVTTQQN